MARASPLEAEISRRTSQGWEIVSRQATEVQMRRPKHFSFLWAFLWFLVFGIGIVVYLVWHWAKRDRYAYLRLEGDRLVVSESRGFLGTLFAPVAAYFKWAAKREQAWGKALALGGPVVAVLVIIIVAAAASGGGEDEGAAAQRPVPSPTGQAAVAPTGAPATTEAPSTPTPRTQESPTPASPTPTPGLPEHQGYIGQAVESGKYQLTVTAVEDPYESGNEFIQPDAGKRFVAVHMELRNTGSSGSISIFPLWDVVLLDSTDLVHEADLMITEFSANELGAGERGTGRVGFEVPVNAQPSRVKLKLSPEKDIIVWLRQP